MSTISMHVFAIRKSGLNRCRILKSESGDSLNRHVPGIALWALRFCYNYNCIMPDGTSLNVYVMLA